MYSAVGVFLFGVGEGAHQLEASPAHKFEKLLEIALRLARKAHHQRRAQVDARNGSANLLNELHRLGLRHVAAHSFQNGVGDVLQGDVEIATHLRILAHHVEQVRRKLHRIGVVQANPLHTVDFGDFPNQIGDSVASVEVKTIVGQLLRNQLQLLHAHRHQFSHFGQDFSLRATLVPPRNDGNGAVSAVAVAAFADFQVGIVRGRGNRAFPDAGRNLLFSQFAKQIHVVELPEIAVHLWNFPFQIAFVALREASHHVESLDFSLVLGLGKFQNGVDALFLGIGNEAAGVDDDDFALRTRRIVDTREAVGLELLLQEFAVNKILGTPHRHNINLPLFHSSDYIVV